MSVSSPMSVQMVAQEHDRFWGCRDDKRNPVRRNHHHSIRRTGISQVKSLLVNKSLATLN